ncbi:T9SS type A sorting domain-containing protein, partial [Balneolaceae bacterium ANBcel3]|nr:T9SS type A sorting domain-containing protein [Balneolaceae bacterium ANBcel3]
KKNLWPLFSAFIMAVVLASSTPVLAQENNGNGENNGANGSNEEKVLIHYWNFNEIPNDVFFSVSRPELLNVSSRLYGALLSYDGGSWDRVNDPTPLNAREVEYSGDDDRALRLRNPSGPFIVHLPTTGYQDVVFRYAVTRTSNGAHQQMIDYSLNGGTSFSNEGIETSLITVLEGEYKLVEIDFSEIEGSSNNPDFLVRIRMEGENSEPDNTSGNQRVNHITLDGVEMEADEETELIHHWDFNNIPNDVNFPVRTAISAGGIVGGSSRVNGAWLRYDGSRWDRVNAPTPFNARAFVYDEEDDRAIRLRNPGGDFVLRLPTTGYKNIVFSYVVKRTSSGAEGQQLTYSTDGSIFVSDGLRYSSIQVGENYIRHRIDFSGITGVENNPDFTIRMTMTGEGSESDNDSGNHRINHVTVDAVKMTPSSAEGDQQLAQEMILEQNYPNPFNPETVIQYSIPAESHVSLRVYDITGRLVETLVDQRMRAGSHSVAFSARNLAGGVYFYRLESGGMAQTRQMTLVK